MIATDSFAERTFTRSEVDRMENAGEFAGLRYELIEGRLVNKMGQSPQHRWSLYEIRLFLASVFEFRRILTQSPVEAAEVDAHRNLPEPDVAVLIESKPEYFVRHPRGDELLLAVEVADSSLLFDLTTKAALYARARIPEYWVLDLSGRALAVHRQPEAGTYRSIARLTEAENVSPQSCSEARIGVSALLPGKKPA
ncbi:MAG: Uma2 family endonuclease [Bryobacteraceae bacterium]